MPTVARHLSRPRMTRLIIFARMAPCADRHHLHCCTGDRQVAQSRGKRCSAASSYLKQAFGRKNLNVQTQAHITKVTASIYFFIFSDGWDRQRTVHRPSNLYIPLDWAHSYHSHLVFVALTMNVSASCNTNLEVRNSSLVGPSTNPLCLAQPC